MIDTISAFQPAMDALRALRSERANVMVAEFERVGQPTGTMRAWMMAHNGQNVDTMQIGYGRKLWAPLGRTIDATSRAGAVLLNGSTRDYKGMRVIAVSDNAIIVGSAHETIGYVITSQ